MTSRFEGLTVDRADPRRPAASPPRSSSSGDPDEGNEFCLVRSLAEGHYDR